MGEQSGSTARNNYRHDAGPDDHEDRMQSEASTSSLDTRAQEAVREQLTKQAEMLRQELDFTHAHYQKLIEAAAGPRWTADLGPLERPELPTEASSGGLPGRAGAGKAAASASFNALTVQGGGEEELVEEEDDGGDGGGGGAAAVAAAPTKKASPGGLGRSLTSINSLETRVKRVEAQLAAQANKLEASERRLTSRRIEADEFRERMSAKDHTQADEMRRLREQVKETRAAIVDVQGLTRHREVECQRRLDEECARLQVDNAALRAQLATLSGSVDSMMATSGTKAAAAKQQEDEILGGADRKIKERVALTVAEKDRQIESLKSQSTYHLARKTDEIAALKEELEAAKANAQASVEALKVEGEYLIQYTESATEVLRRLEAGVYSGATDRITGLRQFKVPPRDKASAAGAGSAQDERLRYLRTAADGMDRLLASTSAASAAAAPSFSQSSTYAMQPPPSASHSSMVLLPGAAHGLPRGTSLRLMGDDVAALGGASSSHSSPGGGGSGEVTRASWEAANRDAITRQVMADLRSDKTIEYIRSLESQLAHYRQELQNEARLSSGKAVALRAAPRESASRPGSPVGAALATATARLCMTAPLSGRLTLTTHPSGQSKPGSPPSGLRAGEHARPGTAPAPVATLAKGLGSMSGSPWSGNGSLGGRVSQGSLGGSGFIREGGAY